MVLVPAGEFSMGSDKGDEDEFPIHRVNLNMFYIDKFEVTNGRFAKFVDAIQSERGTATAAWPSAGGSRWRSTARRWRGWGRGCTTTWCITPWWRA